MSENPIIYLTGAPASGKTSVASYLVSAYGARRYSYGDALHAELATFGVSHEQLRTESGAIVKRQIIKELDSKMPNLIRAWSDERPVVIDSHAVTSERWGLRSIPYDPGTLSAIGITHLLCLTADAKTLHSRIAQAPGGRPVESPERLAQLDHAQMALAMAYAHTLGAPAFVLDATRPLDIVQSDAAECCDLLAQR